MDMFNGKNEASKKNLFLEQAKAAREERAQERRREEAATCLQKFVRGFMTRRRISREVRQQFDSYFSVLDSPQKIFSIEALQAFKVIKELLVVFNESVDKEENKDAVKEKTSKVNVTRKMLSYYRQAHVKYREQKGAEKKENLQKVQVQEKEAKQAIASSLKSTKKSDSRSEDKNLKNLKCEIASAQILIDEGNKRLGNAAWFY